ncbi:zinc finger and BTB domain-containing protein 22 [Bombina bombina]|uniref:zinc finger and BTB domain-containing protein 22 n=1 Tax=Bombina bombina TaxID=8345 RepID=UPI00235B0A87|nr:zinc finger and BTB domain-containing protein 22 [Bombina bombina]
MDAAPPLIHVDFPDVASSLLESLNQQRVEGKLCDVSIHAQGRVFRAHRAVLAASSPYFHDQVLLKGMNCVALPGVVDPAAFEAVLCAAYTGRLTMLADEIVNYLTVGSVLQMWHVVDKCSELLKEARGGSSCGGEITGGGDVPTPQRPHSGRASENQSPSSSNYFSPREAPLESCGERSRTKNEAANEATEEVSVEGDQDLVEASVASCSSYRRPSIVPQRHWVYVKKERPHPGLLLTCEGEEEEEEDELEEDEDEEHLSISDVRTLNAPEEQVNFCEPSDGMPYEDGTGGVSGYPQGPPLLPLDMQGNQLMVLPSGHGAAGQGGTGTGQGGDSGKIFLCHCGKAFSHKSMRDRHVNMHLNLRPFDCPVCGKKFKMKHHLTEHMKTHTGVKPYECEVCAKKFMWRDSFMRHRSHCERRHRGGGTGGGVGQVRKESPAV